MQSRIPLTTSAPCFKPPSIKQTWSSNFRTIKIFQHGYEHYNAEYQKAKVTGGIKTTIYRNRIFLKIVIEKNKEGCVPRLQRVKLNVIKWVCFCFF